jgi:hypothetical protein
VIVTGLERFADSLERVGEVERCPRSDFYHRGRRPIPNALHDHEILTGRNLRDAKPTVRTGATRMAVPRIEMNAPCMGARLVSLTTPSITPNAFGPRDPAGFEPRAKPPPRPATGQ